MSSCSLFVADDAEDDNDDNDVGNDDAVFKEEVVDVDDDSGDCASAGFEWVLS